jgi:fatty-acyl-CoA synthase
MNDSSSQNIYESHLDKNAANHAPLSPLTFISRSASVYPDHTSLIHGDKRFSWAETFSRCRRLASALSKRGIGLGHTVALMAANTPEMYETAFGVPACGAVLNTLNVRLDAENIAFCLEHAEAKVLICDREFSPITKAALEILSQKNTGSSILVIDIDDSLAIGGECFGEMDYEAFIATGDADFPWELPADEWQAISLNYTSGTTGNPKGVVYHHRGAYLNAIGNVMAWQMANHPVYMWTLPMFHCNGWCFPWTLAAVAGTSVCLRRVEPAAVFDAIADHQVTHFCGAPIVLNMMVNAKDSERRDFKHVVNGMTAGAPPPPATLEAIESMGFSITHVYGLTETYGPGTICAWRDEWDELEVSEKAQMKSYQGVRYHVLEGLSVMDPETMTPTPSDGETMGEVMLRGNTVMRGYLKNPKATDDCFVGGWFHSGDLGVMHPNGYIQLKDRSKDIIISGGENISSIEVEGVLYRHPSVLAAAVVAKADEKWGETPCAFVELKEGAETPPEEEIISFCRDNLAHFKAPRTVVFCELPKTSTGKIQKFKLRERANA